MAEYLSLLGLRRCCIVSSSHISKLMNRLVNLEILVALSFLFFCPISRLRLGSPTRLLVVGTRRVVDIRAEVSIVLGQVSALVSGTAR